MYFITWVNFGHNFWRQYLLHGYLLTHWPNPLQWFRNSLYSSVKSIKALILQALFWPILEAHWLDHWLSQMWLTSGYQVLGANSCLLPSQKELAVGTSQDDSKHPHSFDKSIYSLLSPLWKQLSFTWELSSYPFSVSSQLLLVGSTQHTSIFCMSLFISLSPNCLDSRAIPKATNSIKAVSNKEIVECVRRSSCPPKGESLQA